MSKEYLSLDEQKKYAQFKKHLSELEDVYSEVVQIFHDSEHYTVRQTLSAAIRELNEAIYNLREALK